MDTLSAIVDRLGRPPSWCAALRWIHLQAGIALDDSMAVAHAAGWFADQIGFTGRQETLRRAAKCWAVIVRGDVDRPAVHATADALDAAELPWEASRLAGQAAIRAADPDDARRLRAEEEPAAEEEEPQLPADEQCTDAIMSNERWVCITSATITDGQLVIEYEAEWAGSTPSIDGGFHVHFYGADETGAEPPAEIMGTHASSDERGDWYIEDQNPSVHPLDSNQVAALGGASKVCARIADGSHALVPDADSAFRTGNCWPIEEN
jgi:hypothetical protein